MKLIRLGQLFELKYGKSLRKDRRVQGKIPVYGSNGVVDYHAVSLVNKSTIVVGRKGSIGEVHLVSTPCWPIDTTYFVESLGNYDYDLSWLYRLLKTLKLQNLNRSAAIPGLNRDDVYMMQVNLPPLDDQKRIAHLLGKVEGLVARRKQQLQELDNLLKSIFLEMFGDPVRNEKNHRISVLESYITHLTSGGRGWAKYHSPSGKRFIRSLDVQMNVIGSEDVVYVTPPNNKEAERTRALPGDVLLTITGSKIGRVCFVPKDFEEAYVSQHVAIIRTNGINPIYLSFYLSMPNCGQRIIAKQQYGQAKPGLNLTQIQKFDIIDPDIVLQNQFAAIVEKVEKLKARYQRSLAELESLYGALSQKAFKGELDLSRVPLPAEEAMMKDDHERHEKHEMGKDIQEFEFSAPDDLASLQTTEGRKKLIDEWLNAWLVHLGNKPFSVQSFMEEAGQRLRELMDGDEPDWGAAEYDEIKTWVFEALKQGRLEQICSENRILIRSRETKS